MRIEVTIDKNKKLPDGALPALQEELLRRINEKYSDCTLSVRRASTDGLSVLGGEKGDKERIEEILQETWETADDWFY
ncbi:DNA-damage-inducible protein I [Klebsiella variicola]|uniref:DinI-like family protein n=1 Tax=Klebsiella variicola TaxID=244366 RepID=UPI0006721795|nr:DinI-like family protein [Klebsiella variicola]MCB3523224.1 DinI-like family protein [Klebsiella variicola]CTQ13101.1 DNA-damage-inducible protein I [Klebsiella variicola]